MMKVRLSELMESSGIQFGTSGARGLVSGFSDRIAYAYAAAFAVYLESCGQLSPGGRLALAGDLRPSTHRLMAAAARALSDRGLAVVHAGRIPSPALMLYGISHQIPSLMVTGSHIPDDRNGIKFNTPFGEIMKSDEAAMRSTFVELPDDFESDGSFSHAGKAQLPEVDPEAARSYVERFIRAFPRQALRGKLVAVYGHSAVGRELLVSVFEGLGASVVRVGWSERFVPVDTEAIRPEDIEIARDFAQGRDLFALVSTDGDSDRPLVADESGSFFRGDVACLLTARFVGATFVAAPVNCNTALERTGWFVCERTRIGSPYVIEAMSRALQRGEARVVGYEANGGFLSASVLDIPDGACLSPLPTRDPLIVQLSLLCQAARESRRVSELASDVPPRFTASDRLSNFPSELSLPRIRALSEAGAPAIEHAFPELGRLASVDELDGLRMLFESGEILHVRASGNAPELRCYVEAATSPRAESLLGYGLERLAAWRGAAASS